MLDISLRTRQWLALLSVLKLYRAVLCAGRFFHLAHWLKMHTSVVVLDLASVFALLILFGHYTACTFFLVGVLENNEGSWIYSLMPPTCEPGKYDTCPPLPLIYLNCFYWSMCTILSSESQMEILPVTAMDKLFVLLVVVCGAFLVVQEFLRWYPLTPETIKRLRKFKELHWVRTKEIDVQDLLDSLPFSLRVDVKVELLQKLVQNCHMFDGLTSAGMRAVCLRLRQTIVLPFENVIYEGDMAADVFFLSRGRLSVVKNKKHIVLFNPGAVFGEVAVVLNQKRSAGIESVVWSEYWSLSKLEFEELCEEFTELRKWVTSKVHQHLKADLGRKKEGKQGVGLSQSCNKNCASTDTHATRCMHCLSKSLDQCHLINATCSVSLDQCHLIDA